MWNALKGRTLMNMKLVQSMQNNIIQDRAAVSFVKSYRLGLLWSLIRCRYKTKERMNSTLALYRKRSLLILIFF